MPEEGTEIATTPNSDDEDDLRCPICNLKFETESERNLHVLAHPQDCLTKEEILLRRKLFYKEVRKQQEADEPKFGDDVKLSPPKQQHKPRRIYKPPSKRVGLTKIRMEDCLRCDACSCIYIDPQDYYKHMRNFHQKYNTVIPRTRRRSPHRTSQQDLPVSSPEEVTLTTSRAGPLWTLPLRNEKPKEQKAPLDTTFVAESIIRQSIKSRWSKVVSERLSTAKRPRLVVEGSPETPEFPSQIKIDGQPVEAVGVVFDPNLRIKEEPADEDNILDLLSQVEVKIKTEPPDDYGSF
uniref:C2H2-type domain-containing protein n=3 Tax=Lygus hesperus TaxID=30085 RepID=A0A0A9W872_LYGHE